MTRNDVGFYFGVSDWINYRRDIGNDGNEREEAMRRLGMALHHIHESTSALKEIDGVER